MPRSLFSTVLLLLALFVTACNPSTPPVESAEGQVAGAFDALGETFSPVDALPIPVILAEGEQYIGQVVRIEGQATEVCQQKGCWATFVSDAGTVRLRMPRNADDSDYLFTLPKDLAGQRIIAQGTLSQRELPADEVQHYAEDAGEDVSERTFTPVVEWQLNVNGVLIPKS